MRSYRTLLILLAGTAFLLPACSGDLSEEKARLAAEKARDTIRPLDYGAMEQNVDAATIKTVQEELTVLKEYMGPISGKLDPVTLNALEAFQRNHDILADGRFNSDTLKALAAAAKKHG